MDSMIFFCEVLGTIAFSVSGAFVGLRNKSDIFGVMILGIVTATCGGMIRDVVLGRIPPASFVNPVYIEMAAITAIIVFAIAKYMENSGKNISSKLYSEILFLMDSIGLGIFVAVGCNAAFRMYGADNALIVSFCGMITGVGGGMTRDILVAQQPAILRTDIYATAALAGAYISCWCFRLGNEIAAIWVPVVFVFVLRVIVRKYNLNLPKVDNFHGDE